MRQAGIGEIAPVGAGTMMRRTWVILVRAFGRLLVSAIATLNVMALLGFFVRDSNRVLGLCLYLPVVPLGALAIVLGLGLEKEAGEVSVVSSWPSASARCSWADAG